MTRLIDFRCTSCGGAEISYDASAEWDAGQQQFEVRSTYDACFCNSEECQGEKRSVAEFDAQSGEALGLGPRSFEYIPKEQADAEGATYHEDRARQQEQIIHENAEALAAAHREFGDIVVLETRAIVEMTPTLCKHHDQPWGIFQMRFVVIGTDGFKCFQPLIACTTFIEPTFFFFGSLADALLEFWIGNCHG